MNKLHNSKSVTLGDIVDYTFDCATPISPITPNTQSIEGTWSAGKSSIRVEKGYLKNISDHEILAFHEKSKVLSKQIESKLI